MAEVKVNRIALGLKIQLSLRNIKQNVYMAVLSLKERSILTDSKSFVHCQLGLTKRQKIKAIGCELECHK